MESVSDIWDFASKNPIITFLAGAITLRFIEYMFDRYKDRKKVKITPRFGFRTDAKGNKSFELLVKNVGAKPIGVHYFGYRTWKGGGIDTKNERVMRGELLEPEQEPWELAFYDGVNGNYLAIPEDGIYYYFIETGDKVFRQYTYFALFAWLKRLIIYLNSVVLFK